MPDPCRVPLAKWSRRAVRPQRRGARRFRRDPSKEPESGGATFGRPCRCAYDPEPRAKWNPSIRLRKEVLRAPDFEWWLNRAPCRRHDHKTWAVRGDRRRRAAFPACSAAALLPRRSLKGVPPGRSHPEKANGNDRTGYARHSRRRKSNLRHRCGGKRICDEPRKAGRRTSRTFNVSSAAWTSESSISVARNSPVVTSAYAKPARFMDAGPGRTAARKLFSCERRTEAFIVVPGVTTRVTSRLTSLVAAEGTSI